MISKRSSSLAASIMVLAILLVLNACSTKDAAIKAGSGRIEASADYALLRWENRALFNNHWGQGYLKEGSSHTGKVYYDAVRPIIGWEWSWPKERADMLKAYPCLIIGDKPCTPAGFDESTDPRFPLPLASMKELWVEGDLEVSGTGAFNFAFDLALLEGPRSTVADVRTEIMIWIYAQTPCGAKRRGSYTVDEVVYDLHVNTDWNPAVPYLAFIPTNGIKPRRFPLHEFISIACDLGFYGPEACLAAIELGPEIWHGDGRATLSDLKVTLVMK